MEARSASFVPPSFPDVSALLREVDELRGHLRALDDELASVVEGRDVRSAEAARAEVEAPVEAADLRVARESGHDPAAGRRREGHAPGHEQVSVVGVVRRPLEEERLLAR